MRVLPPWVNSNPMSGDNGDKKLPSRGASPAEVEAFLQKAAAVPRPGQRRGRLLFAIDATASREPTWDRAAHIQAEMFQEAAALGGLEMQVAFYRGFGEFKATPWLTDADKLLRMMQTVRCLAGQTQIDRVLRHAVREAKAQKVNAVVFVGDCMEENVDKLAQAAGELGVLNVPVFLFHEGDDPVAANAFQHIARLSGGACLRFDPSSPQQLRDLLKAVAVFAAGGRQALADYSRKQGGMVLRLTDQMKGR